ncbi:MAG: S41 family peptidase [Lysobacterales bacterium]
MRKLLSRFAGVCLLLLAPTGFAQKQNESGRADIVREAVKVISGNAYKASSVDWQKAEAAALEILASNDSSAGLNASVQYLVSKLEDGHSSYRPAVEGGQAPVAPGFTPTPLAARPIGERVESSGRFPIIRVNAWGGVNAAVAQTAAATLREVLNTALDDDVCGLVLDFSANSGGNMWPMLAGLLPIYSEGLLGAFEGAAGKRTSIVSSGNSLALDGRPHYLNAPQLPLPRFLPSHIAILIGPRTASSGEIVALILAAQANSRTFGAATAGRSSANRMFKMSDGSVLVLTTAATVDRNGLKHWGAITPDIESSDALEAASSWLSGQCK